MNRRIVAAFVAAALALVAFLSIFLYVRNADVRALNGVAVKSVYVVVNPITKGTLAENLGSNIELTQIPAKTVPVQAVSDLGEIQSKVAAVDLVAGEILLTTRFVDPAAATQDSVAVPKGMEQMSIATPVTIDGDTITKQIMNKVLVTRVQGGITPASDATGTSPLPAGSVMLTVALTTSDIEKLTWAQSAGTLLLI